MTETNTHMVFSHPPANVSEEEFLRWYEGHLAEILQAPQFVSAKLFRLQPSTVNERHPVPYSFMAAYEFEGDAAAAMDGIRAIREAGLMDLPDWFGAFEGEECLISWNCMALTRRVEPVAKA